MNRWIILNDADVVQNIIVWDGQGQWLFPEGWRLLPAVENVPIQIGWYWNDGDQKPVESGQ